MSIHRSLKSADTMKRHRSVLSRLERVRILEGRGELDPDQASVFGLPKVKHLRIRIKKEKAAEGPKAEGEVAAPAPKGGTAAPAPKGGAAAAAPKGGAAPPPKAPAPKK